MMGVKLALRLKGSTICRTVAVLALLICAAAPVSADPFAVHVRYDDVERFFQVLDAGKGHPSAAALQRDYIDSGSAGVRDFVPYRIESAQALAETISKEPALFEKARRCRALLPNLEKRVRPSYLAFQQVLPDARLPETTILIGRGRSPISAVGSPDNDGAWIMSISSASTAAQFFCVWSSVFPLPWITKSYSPAPP
jgi:hypothetical protein